jgi:uncharacterized membrane protein
METSIATMLFAGVVSSGIFVLAGGVLYTWRNAKAIPDYNHFAGHIGSLRNIAGILHRAMMLDPRSLIQLGVLLLIATPVVRVVFCIVGFARQRDRIYVFISSSVLVILIYSFLQSGR